MPLPDGDGLPGDFFALLGGRGRAQLGGVGAIVAVDAFDPVPRLREQAAADGARHGQRAVPGGEIALRIAVAAVEDPPLLGAPLYELALLALGAPNSGLVLDLLGVLALRKPGAGQEAAEAAQLDDHVAPALGAL